ALDNAFQHLKEDEIPEALGTALYTCVRDPKKERFTTFVNRRRLEFITLERLKVMLPDTFKSYSTLRFARLDERSYDKVIGWTDGGNNFEQIAKCPAPPPPPIDMATTDKSDELGAFAIEVIGHEDDGCDDGEGTLQISGSEAIAGAYYIDAEWLDGVIGEEDLPWALLDMRPAMSYLVERKQVRNQLNEARKARGFFKPKGKSKGKHGHGQDKGKGSGKQNQRRRISIDQLKLRTKCAKCKQVGHWARACPQNGHQQRLALEAFTMHAAVGSSQTHHINMPRPAESTTGGAAKFFVGAIAMFIGLAINARGVLVDAGVQEGIIGAEQLKGLVLKLKEFNLQPRWAPDDGPPPRGIGGDAEFTGRAEVPVGIAGASGILSFCVVDEEVPALIPVGLIRALEMDLKLRGSGDQ
ncbi:unnamed protein product, partial [Prorocentrum cordatum]